MISTCTSLSYIQIVELDWRVSMSCTICFRSYRSSDVCWSWTRLLTSCSLNTPCRKYGSNCHPTHQTVHTHRSSWRYITLIPEEHHYNGWYDNSAILPLDRDSIDQGSRTLREMKAQTYLAKTTSK